MDPNVVGKLVPESQRTQFNFLVSKKHKDVEKLKNWASKQISEVWKTGKFIKVYSKWVSEGVAKDYVARFKEFHEKDIADFEASMKK